MNSAYYWWFMMDLTKYELARIIGARALQLSCGAPPLIKVINKGTSFIEVAQLELDKNVIPLSVVRNEN
jgi:DNA-directed RNA polymerase subunit K/omega